MIFISHYFWQPLPTLKISSFRKPEPSIVWKRQALAEEFWCMYSLEMALGPLSLLQNIKMSWCMCKCLFHIKQIPDMDPSSLQSSLGSKRFNNGIDLLETFPPDRWDSRAHKLSKFIYTPFFLFQFLVHASTCQIRTIKHVTHRKWFIWILVANLYPFLYDIRFYFTFVFH